MFFKMCFFAFLFPVLAFSAGSTGSFKITGVDILDNRGFSIFGNFPKTECTHGGGHLFIEFGATQYKAFLASAQLAYLLQSPVEIYFNDCRTVGYYYVPTTKVPTIVGAGGNFRMLPK